LRADTQAIRLR